MGDWLWVVDVSKFALRATPGGGRRPLSKDKSDFVSCKQVFGAKYPLRKPEISNASTPPTLIAFEGFALGRYGAWNGDLLEREFSTDITCYNVPIAIDASDRVLVANRTLERYAPDFSDFESFEYKSLDRISHIFADESSAMWFVITLNSGEYYRVPE